MCLRHLALIWIIVLMKGKVYSWIYYLYNYKFRFLLSVKAGSIGKDVYPVTKVVPGVVQAGEGLLKISTTVVSIIKHSISP